MIENLYDYSKNHLDYLFKKMYREEFKDPNESFELFLLSLIPKEKIAHLLLTERNYYYDNIKKFL